MPFRALHSAFLFSHTVGVFAVFISACASSGQPAAQPAPVYAPQPDALDRAIDALSEQIVSRLTDAQKSKLGVNEFLTLKGETNDLGKFLSEELTTRLINSQRAQVVERRLLQKVLSEQEMGASNLVDDETAARVGKLLGADTLCTGTMTDLGTEIKINARLINAETAEVYGAASIDLPKNRAVMALLGGSGMRPSITTGPAPRTAAQSSAQQTVRNPPPQTQPTMQPVSSSAQRPAFIVGQAPTRVMTPSPAPTYRTDEPALYVGPKPPTDGPDVLLLHNKTRFCLKVWMNGKLLRVVDGTQDAACVRERERAWIRLSSFGEYRIQASGSPAQTPFNASVAYDKKHTFSAQQKRVSVVLEASDFYNLQ
jgi:curli biogenesis system outer membrane secretion channel CsgG